MNKDTENKQNLQSYSGTLQHLLSWVTMTVEEVVYIWENLSLLIIPKINLNVLNRDGLKINKQIHNWRNREQFVEPFLSSTVMKNVRSLANRTEELGELMKTSQDCWFLPLDYFGFPFILHPRRIHLYNLPEIQSNHSDPCRFHPSPSLCCTSNF